MRYQVRLRQVPLLSADRRRADADTRSFSQSPVSQSVSSQSVGQSVSQSVSSQSPVSSPEMGGSQSRRGAAKKREAKQVTERRFRGDLEETMLSFLS